MESINFHSIDSIKHNSNYNTYNINEGIASINQSHSSKLEGPYPEDEKT